MSRKRSELDIIEQRLALLDPERAGQIVYTVNPQRMLAAVREDPRTFVVSSWALDSGLPASYFACATKRISSKTVFFVYGDPPAGGYPSLDGIDLVIPAGDPGPYDVLVRILARVNAETTVGSLRREFPKILG